MKLSSYLSRQAAIVNKALNASLPKGNALIARAMKYSVSAGGKRLRPILVMEAARLCGSNYKKVAAAACAVEFLHTYSLIHDDLPSMDNDDLRRGRPTSHKKFGEAAAILAGDALLTDAFRLITKTKSSPKAVVDCIRILAESAGYNGMIGGQAKDTIEASKWKMKNKKQSKKDLSYIHKNKTAALISASLLIGATMANASKKQKKALNAYGQKTGLAFQIVDDILDITANKKLLGKKGSDRNNDKLTYPAVYGIEKSKKMAVKLVKEAKNNLRIFDKKAEILGKIADYIIERKF